jgi:hypothetical protein
MNRLVFPLARVYPFSTISNVFENSRRYLQLSLEAGESFEIQLQLKTKKLYFSCTYTMSKVRPKHTFVLLLLMLNSV